MALPESYEQQNSIYTQGTRNQATVFTAVSNDLLSPDWPSYLLSYPSRTDDNSSPKMPYIAHCDRENQAPLILGRSNNYDPFDTWPYEPEGVNSEDCTEALREQWLASTQLCEVCSQSSITGVSGYSILAPGDMANFSNFSVRPLQGATLQSRD
jgi:hypothetical protein